MRLIDADVSIEKLKSLPIELDAKTIQRCIEVLSNMPSADHTKQFREAYELAMKALRKTERKTGKWIPCSERLPEPNRHDALNVDVYYLAQTEFGDMIVASYNESHEGTKWWEQMYSYRIFDDEIIAWMPLPPSYREDGE